LLFFYKIAEQEGDTGTIWMFGTSGRRDDMGKACRRENMVQILCTHVCKWKMIPVEIILEMGTKVIKESELEYDIFDTL
jgi:hypothetical protein